MPAVAIATAVGALVLSVVAVIVAASRGGGDHVAAVDSTKVSAEDLVKLRREAVEAVSENGKVIGVRVTDDKLRATLGLDSGDVITSLGGRAIKREFDAYDAVLGVTAMFATTVHVDLVRAGKPVHVRWEIAGDLRAARRAPALGDSSGTTGRDPLFDTIKKIDDTHFEIPRSTIERIAANPADYANGARVVPSVRMGIVDGFKIYAVRPTSLYAAIGLTNGDTIRAVNGFETNSIDKLLEIYTKVKDAKELAIDITRRGSYELITVTVK